MTRGACLAQAHPHDFHPPPNQLHFIHHRSRIASPSNPILSCNRGSATPPWIVIRQCRILSPFASSTFLCAEDATPLHRSDRKILGIRLDMMLSASRHDARAVTPIRPFLVFLSLFSVHGGLANVACRRVNPSGNASRCASPSLDFKKKW